MSQNITTTGNIKVQDITFKHARRQNEIDKELGREEPTKEEVKAPVSLTPEQVVDFYKQSIQNTDDTQTKMVYAQTIKWIKELQDTKSKLALLIMQKERSNNGEEHPTDLEE